MKRVLITSTDVMCFLFLIPHINRLVEDGFAVDVACSSAKEFSDQDYEKKIRDKIPDQCTFYLISSSRSPTSFANVRAYKELKVILKNGKYDLVWTNEPVIGLLTRLASIGFRRSGLKVLYLVHGLHFFKGSPILNWAYFPIEFFASFITDLTVTINKLDTKFVDSFFFSPAKYIQGIGFPHSKFSFKSPFVDYLSLRHSLGFKNNDIILLAVGELMHRKNHVAAIKALSKNSNQSVKLLICGVGPLYKDLAALSDRLNLSDRVLFAGLRDDIPSLLKVCDIFIHPSTREGLGIAPLEAMASGLPIVTSNAQGIVDYSVDGITGFVCEPNNIDCFTTAIDKLVKSPSLRQRIGEKNVQRSYAFDISNSTDQMSEIINSLVVK